jgi:hypothetical protein
MAATTESTTGSAESEIPAAVTGGGPCPARGGPACKFVMKKIYEAIPAP